jgi:hypothetical protein
MALQMTRAEFMARPASGTGLSQAKPTRLGRSGFDPSHEDLEALWPANGGPNEVPPIHGDDGVRAAVHRSFQHHVVIGIRQHRAPAERKALRLGNQCHRIQQFRNLVRGYSRRR